MEWDLIIKILFETYVYFIRNKRLRMKTERIFQISIVKCKSIMKKVVQTLDEWTINLCYHWFYGNPFEYYCEDWVLCKNDWSIGG